MSRKLDNWLERYLEFTQNSEPPVIYHLWTGIVAIASCLQRKCYINWGHAQIIYPNLYAVLVGPPGGRKGTAMKIGKEFLTSIDISLSSDSLGSIQALYNEINTSRQMYIDPTDGLDREHKSLSVWSEEFQVFLNSLDQRFVLNLTDLFDCPSRWKYSSIGRGMDDLSNCWLTIFGATTPSLLQSSLSQDAVGGGLISRIIFVVGYGKAKKVPITFLSKEEIELHDLLAEDLEDIKNMTGPFDVTQEFMDVYSQWYLSPHSTAGVDNDKFVGYNERRALHLRKLCMIISASESSSRLLEAKHLYRALHILEMTEKEMPNAFYGLGTAQHSNVLTNVLTFLKENKTVPWGALINRFKLDIDTVNMERVLETLTASGDVTIDFDMQQKRHITFNQAREEINSKDYMADELFKHLK